MLQLKASRHNFFFDADDGYVLAYNAFSNSFARVSSEEFNLIKNLLDDPNNPSYSSETYERSRNDLKKGSFLVDEILDELDILEMRYKLGRFSQDFLGLTICPTFACDCRAYWSLLSGRSAKKMGLGSKPMSIITNGYRLTRDNAKKLKELDIVSAHVTIDGLPEIHGRRRKLNNGSGTFFKIIENIKESMDVLDKSKKIQIKKGG